MTALGTRSAIVSGRSTFSLVAATGLVVIASSFGSEDGPVLCLFRRCTGGYCPGCGGSRAVGGLLRGDIAGSWATHPWVPLLALQALASIVVALLGRAESLRAMAPKIIAANAAFAVVLWVYRMAAGDIPVPFA